MRFYILKNNGLVFQSQVAYIIPIFGLIFGYLFLDEKITYKIIVALIAVLISTYLIEKSKKVKVTDKLSRCYLLIIYCTQSNYVSRYSN